ncbi:MAG: hypothetical protein A3E78_17265 [Alphaproteobacteria bacterium RIFCSPHIGHO2_12_FULL_63_12]|nr:MAG: hypothetical protein A3E78_17265 [Alphaproteobacteria bacterium RIFCSPHIGHO2_12_FULL_63_12]
MGNSDTSRKGVRSLFLLAAASAGLFVFMATAGLVMSGSTLDLDQRVLLALRAADDLRQPVGPDWLLPAAREVTALGGTPLLTLLTLSLVGFFAVKGQGRTILILLAAVIGETILSGLLKDLFDRPRPSIVPHLVKASSNSFPSGHATSAAAIYLTLAVLIARDINERIVRNYVFFVAVTLALLVGASRVYLGVHYPTDVIGGLGFGAAWAAIVLIAARKLQ